MAGNTAMLTFRMLTSQLIHQRTFADGWETNEATANISTLPSQISANDLHTSNTSTRNIETGWSLLSLCDNLRLGVERLTATAAAT